MRLTTTQQSTAAGTLDQKGGGDTIKDELAQRENVKPDEPLFLNQYGTRYKKMRKALKTACETAKVPHCTHHSLRHAYATILHEKGKDRAPFQSSSATPIQPSPRTSLCIGETSRSIRLRSILKSAAKCCKEVQNHESPCRDCLKGPTKLLRGKCRGTELNRRRRPFQGRALPSELPRLGQPYKGKGGRGLS
jgi:hypothetical protein